MSSPTDGGATSNTLTQIYVDDDVFACLISVMMIAFVSSCIRLINVQSIGYIIYNDEPSPDSGQNTSFVDGHSKGVLAWDQVCEIHGNSMIM